MQLDNTKPYIIVVEDLLSQEECEYLIHFIDNNEPTPAPVITLHGEFYPTFRRKNIGLFPIFHRVTF